jgi:tetratricopeptide (TPR) repeat protein
MDPNTLADEIAAAPDLASARTSFRLARGVAGFSGAYFARVLNAFGSDVESARQLSAGWPYLLRYGDDPALAYRTKGISDRLAARWLPSARAFMKAGTLAFSERDRLSFQVGAVDSLARAGRIEEAIDLGTELVNGLSALGETGLAGRVRLNMGNALLWADRYSEAKQWLSQAIVALREGGHTAEAVFALVGLSTAELFGGSPALAHRLATEAVDLASAQDLKYTTAIAELNQAQAALIQGRADEALRALLDALPKLDASPTDRARISLFLGDSYVRLNLWSEGLDAYAEALSRHNDLPILNVAAVELGIGQALVSSGDPASALAHLRKAEGLYRRCGNRPWHAASKSCRAKAMLAQGRVRAAATLASAAVIAAHNAQSPYHETESLLTLADCKAAMGVDLGPELKRANRLISRHGYRSMAWRVPALKALVAPPAKKIRAYSRAVDAILETRLLTSSTISRAAYMKDKAGVLSTYLGILLEKPTPKRVRKALQVVTRSRSSALLEEILATATVAFKPDQLAQLEQLRMELQALESEGTIPGSTRRTGATKANVSTLYRKWIEATHSLIDVASPTSSTSAAVVLAQAGNGLFALRGSKAYDLRFTQDELNRCLQWIRFELLAPMADRGAPAEPACDLLRSLGERLITPWWRGSDEAVSISPEAQLWQVPWATCLTLLDSATEPVLALHPTLTNMAQLKISSRTRAMLWVHRAEDLSYVEQEEKAFLERFPDSVTCRSAAEARQALTQQVDLLHVISHARHNRSNPMFSAIQFSDGSLYAAEIARSSFRAQIVALSACETANVTASMGDEPDGLARAFLARGAKSVFGSTWPLDDEAASRMFKNLFSAMLDGASPREALRAAREKARAWNPHPYFWGSLVLFGGYAK